MLTRKATFLPLPQLTWSVSTPVPVTWEQLMKEDNGLAFFNILVPSLPLEPIFTHTF